MPKYTPLLHCVQFIWNVIFVKMMYSTEVKKKKKFSLISHKQFPKVLNAFD